AHLQRRQRTKQRARRTLEQNGAEPPISRHNV
ncbi:MAG: hypothetical protein ACI8RN_002240, partial [Glaciecola sp.]